MLSGLAGISQAASEAGGTQHSGLAFASRDANTPRAFCASTFREERVALLRKCYRADFDIRYGLTDEDSLLNIYVDADACPVKEEVSRVAKRHQLSVTYVANSAMRLPEPDATLIVVEGNPDAADHWIAEHAEANDIVVTGDIPLAFRCIQKGAKAVGNSGHVFNEENIGHLLATRDLMAELRNDGTVSQGHSGPPPFQKQDRSRFLHALDEIIQTVKRKAK